MAEYYIRQPGATEARGPFNEDKMTSLAEAGQLTPEMEYQDEHSEEWKPIGASPQMQALLFPERKKLGLKRDGPEFKAMNQPEAASAAPITVEKLLAAAEGESAETKHLKDEQRKTAKAAALALPVLTVMMVLSGLANTVPHYDLIMDVVQNHKWVRLLEEPFVVVGAADFFFALCLFLNVSQIFPLLRFRAMLGLGYFGYFYWAHDNLPGMAAAVGAGLGLFVCTLTLNLYLMIVFALMGILGMGSLAWLAWTASAAGAGG